MSFLRKSAVPAVIVLGVAGAAPAAEVLHWSFNEGSGTTAEDQTANNFDGTLVNGPTYVPGRSGTAVNLDGVDDYVMSPAITSAVNTTDTVSLAIWFKPVAGTGGVIVSEVGQNQINAGWHDSQLEILPSGEVRARVWDSGGISLGVIPVNAFDQWHHAVLRYNGATDTLDGFLNGMESAAKQTGFDRQAPWEHGNQQIYALGAIDTTHLGDGTYFNGALDEFHVYNHALTQAEVNALVAVPEPAGLALLGIAGIGLLARRRNA